VADPTAALASVVDDLLGTVAPLTFRRAVWAPAIWQRLRDIGCPRCGRRLPGPQRTHSSYPGFPSLTDAEKINDCLVDGPRAKFAIPTDLAALDSAADQAADGLRTLGWRKIPRLLQEARRAASDAEKAELIGERFILVTYLPHPDRTFMPHYSQRIQEDRQGAWIVAASAAPYWPRLATP
jgi:hypothetical protein